MGLSNSYFSFKQFTVHQGDCAMKVTTDACIQGAWTPVPKEAKQILDIGAGTGLLSLMLAQKTPSAIIDAVELDEKAAMQARKNFVDSPWADHLNVICSDIQGYTAEHKYDLIISNPPFFNHSLKGPEEARNNARHTTTLTYEDLFKSIDANLNTGGLASVLLPRPESDLWEKLVEKNGWHIHNSLHVKDNDNAIVKRIVFLLGRHSPDKRQTQQLVIKQSDGSYTEPFKQLLRPYYLKL